MSPRPMNGRSKPAPGAKADDVELCTISFGPDVTAASKLMLKNRASGERHYFDAADATKLVDAFDEIAYRVTQTCPSN